MDVQILFVPGWIYVFTQNFRTGVMYALHLIHITRFTDREHGRVFTTFGNNYHTCDVHAPFTVKLIEVLSCNGFSAPPVNTGARDHGPWICRPFNKLGCYFWHPCTACCVYTPVSSDRVHGYCVTHPQLRWKTCGWHRIIDIRPLKYSSVNEVVNRPTVVESPNRGDCLWISLSILHAKIWDISLTSQWKLSDASPVVMRQYTRFTDDERRQTGFHDNGWTLQCNCNRWLKRVKITNFNYFY